MLVFLRELVGSNGVEVYLVVKALLDVVPGVVGSEGLLQKSKL